MISRSLERRRGGGVRKPTRPRISVCEKSHSARVNERLHLFSKRDEFAFVASDPERRVIMTAKFSVQAAFASAIAGNLFRKQFGGKRVMEETCRSQIWREEVAEILEANLTNLNAMSHGFAPSHVQRMTGF
jgi:hypothetical protein